MTCLKAVQALRGEGTYGSVGVGEVELLLQPERRRSGRAQAEPTEAAPRNRIAGKTIEPHSRRKPRFGPGEQHVQIAHARIAVGVGETG